jgi:hypothetical protein
MATGIRGTDYNLSKKTMRTVEIEGITHIVIEPVYDLLMMISKERDYYKKIAKRKRISKKITIRQIIIKKHIKKRY